MQIKLPARHNAVLVAEIDFDLTTLQSGKFRRRICAVRNLLRNLVGQTVIHNTRLQRNTLDRRKLGNRNKRIGFICAFLQVVNGRQCTLHRGRIQVVHQNHRSIRRIHNSIVYTLLIAVFPILRIYIPVDNRQAQFLGNRLNIAVDAAANRTQYRGGCPAFSLIVSVADEISF